MSTPSLTALSRSAKLVDSLYQPIPTTLGDALDQWRRLDPARRAAAYLVVDGDQSKVRYTLNAAQIAVLIDAAALSA